MPPMAQQPSRRSALTRLNSAPAMTGGSNSSLAKAAAAGSPDSVSSNANESQDVLSPLPTSSLARAAATAVSKSGSSALGRTNSSNKRKKKTSHVRVVARIRPLNAAEISRGYSESVHPIDVEDDNDEDAVVPFAGSPSSSGNNDALCSPKSNNHVSDATAFKTPKIGNTTNGNCIDLASEMPTVLPKTVSITAGTDPAKSKQFEYDAVFPPDVSQKAVYDLSVGEAVKRNIFRGFNTTIIAYGQTGSGKTYTMDGPSPTEEIIAEEEEMLSPSARPFVSPKHRGLSPKRNTSRGGRRSSSTSSSRVSGIPRRQSSVNNGNFLSKYDGIIPRAIHDLFETKKEQQREAKIHISYLEIYNDSIRDLLGNDDTSSENLQLRDDGQGISIKGLKSLEVKTAMDAKELMDVASVRRTTGATGSNARSSRSHAMCILTVSINHGKRKRSKAKLTLVDLAGSERLKQTGAEGLTKQEGISINRDLFVLSKVVSALADRSKQGRRSSVTHIPYRDCKLTRILRDSLGGNCCTVMVACISPAKVNLEESINTLRYAQRAKAITNAVKQNVVARSLSSTESLAMQRENKLLKGQISDLMKTLNDLKLSILSKKEEEEDESKENLPEETSAPTTPTDAKIATAADEEEKNEAYKENEATPLKNDIFLDTFNQDDGVDDDLLSVDVDDASSFCDYSIASSITMLDDSIADSIDMEVTEKRELLERLDGESSKLQEQIDSLSKQVTATNEELQEASAKKLEVEASVKEMTATQHRIQYEIDSMKHQIRVLTTERKELLDEIEEVQELAAVITLLNEEQDSRRLAETEINRFKEEATANAAERDALCNKLAKIETDMDRLKKALEIMANENASLKNELYDKENQESHFAPAVGQKPSANVLGERNANIDQEGKKGVNTAVETKGLGAESDSVNPEHRAIRIHAAKMLWFANKSVEKRHNFADMSAVSSIASNQSMDSTNYLDSAENSVASMESSNSKSSKKTLKKKLGLSKLSRKSKRKNKLPPTGMPESLPNRDLQAKETIDGLAVTPSPSTDEFCTCTTPIFGQNANEMEFYLPQLTNSLCTCGKIAKEDLTIKEGDPSSLENILRPWQVSFLATVGITTVNELASVGEGQRESICKAMKKYRKKIAADKPAKTQACAVALHIWIKTCSTVLKNEHDGGPAMPNFLDISFCSRDDSISTIGGGSINSGVISALDKTNKITTTNAPPIGHIR